MTVNKTTACGPSFDVRHAWRDAMTAIEHRSIEILRRRAEKASFHSSLFGACGAAADTAAQPSSGYTVNDLFAMVDFRPSVHFIRQVRFPRSKKRRIRKKWRNRLENFVPDQNLYQMNGAIYGHPDTIKKVLARLERERCL